MLISGVAVGQELPDDTNEIKTLTVEQVKALAERRDQLLFLNGLTTLDATTAKALAEHKGVSLELGGLTTLDAATAKALAEYKGTLSLYGLTTLCDEAAAALQENPQGGTHLKRRIVLPYKFHR